MLNRIELFFVNLWNDIVIFIMSRLISLKIKLLRRKYRNAPTIAPEPTPEVKVGDVAINSEWQWIKVKNPKGRRNGNAFHDFGDSAGIKLGGKLTAVVIDGDAVLVSYESPRGQGYGSEAGNGTLFYVPKRVFTGMTKGYERNEERRNEEKTRILSLLRETLATKYEVPERCTWNQGTDLQEWCEAKPEFALIAHPGVEKKDYIYLCAEHKDQAVAAIQKAGKPYQIVPVSSLATQLEE